VKVSSQQVKVMGVGVSNLIANTSVVNAGEFAGAEQYSGPANDTFTLAIELTFSGCNDTGAKCPSSMTNVTLSTPGFSVSGAVPGLPLEGDDHGTNGAVEDFNIVITVVPPAAGYSGPLNIECTTA
jgi:hypothetical protein